MGLEIDSKTQQKANEIMKLKNDLAEINRITELNQKEIVGKDHEISKLTQKLLEIDSETQQKDNEIMTLKSNLEEINRITELNQKNMVTENESLLSELETNRK